MDLGLRQKECREETSNLLGCTLRVYKLCACAGLKAKESSETTTETSIIKRMWELTGLKQGPGATPHLEQYPEGRTWRPKASSLPEECGRGGWITSNKGTDIDLRWAR